MEKVLDYEQDLGGPKEDPTRPMKAPQGPLDTMIRKLKHIYFITFDRKHVTNDTWCGVNILSKFQLSSSNGLGFMML